MRKATVPIDMSSEQKSVMGFVSIRQGLYMVASVIFFVRFSIWLIEQTLPFIFTGIIIFVLFFSLLIGVYFFAFHKIPKYHMYFDKYLLVLLRRKNQRGIWRRTRYTPKRKESQP